MAIDYGAEAIMDLSNYGKTNTFRKELIDYSPAMIGTVPMYDAIGYLEKDLMNITAKDFLKVVEAHAKEGVDFMTIHAGINRRSVEAFKRDKRMMNIVSRGGSLLFAWMEMTGNENPFFEYYDDVLDILAVDLIGIVPDDENIVISTNQGEPLVGSNTPAGKAYQNICNRVMGKDVPFMEITGPTFFQRLANVFKK